MPFVCKGYLSTPALVFVELPFRLTGLDDAATGHASDRTCAFDGTAVFAYGVGRVRWQERIGYNAATALLVEETIFVRRIKLW